MATAMVRVRAVAEMVLKEPEPGDVWEEYQPTGHVDYYVDDHPATKDEALRVLAEEAALEG